MTSYSYSLDREHWMGRYQSRTEALDAGIAHGQRESSLPETVYVGQRVEPNSRTYGHARSILENIRRRVREDNGDVADDYLKSIGDAKIAELDSALEQTIRAWMQKNNLEPAWVRVEAVGEYPLPAVVGIVGR